MDERGLHGAGTTSYQDTGLASGTTYTYRVRATGGNGSGYSNSASATTTGTAAPAATDSLWSNSYTPNENGYASGSYELGMRFSTDVSGTVTGVKFYKQTWMGGYAHVGHLWSSNGALLASVTFTNETGFGWQQATFSNPVALTPGATYEISFSTGGGYFGITTNGFGSTDYSNGPLHALPNSWSNGGNGVYGAMGSFPRTNGNGMNFWVDVMFSPSTSPAVTSSASVATSPVVTFSTDGEWNSGRSTAAATTVSAPTGSPSSASWTSDRSVAQTTGYTWSGRNRNLFGIG